MIDVAPGANSLADVGRKVNSAYGLQWADHKWRSFWKNRDSLRKEVQGRLTKSPPVYTSQESSTFDVDRYIRLQVEASEELAKKNKFPSKIQITIDTDSPIGLCFPSDWHVGGSGVLYAMLRRDNILMSSHARMYSILGGDWGNNFVINELLHAGESDIFRAGEQQKTVFERELSILDPLAVGVGNHDGWLRRVSGLDPANTWLGSMRPYAIEEGGVIELTVGNILYRVWRRHKPRRRRADDPCFSVQWEYRNGNTDFDIGVLEHDHVPWVGRFNGHTRDDGSTDRVAIRTGTYKTTDSYAIENGYQFGSHKIPSVVLWPDKRRMMPVLGLEDLQDILDGNI